MKTSGSPTLAPASFASSINLMVEATTPSSKPSTSVPLSSVTARSFITMSSMPSSSLKLPRQLARNSPYLFSTSLSTSSMYSGRYLGSPPRRMVVRNTFWPLSISSLWVPKSSLLRPEASLCLNESLMNSWTAVSMPPKISSSRSSSSFLDTLVMRTPLL